MREYKLKYKKIDTKKMLSFGFVKNDGIYVYKTDILDGQFYIELIVSNGEKLFARVVEKEFDEEYTLHLVPEAVGSFVGAVRGEVEKLVEKFERQCCETEIFKCRQTYAVIEYVKNTYGSDIEFLWEKSPDSAVFRRSDNKKWYGIIMTVPFKRLGVNSDEEAEVVNLKAPPENIDRIIDSKSVFPAYHMNKTYWVTVVLNGSISNKDLFSYIDTSYILAKGKSKQKN